MPARAAKELRESGRFESPGAALTHPDVHRFFDGLDGNDPGTSSFFKGDRP